MRTETVNGIVYAVRWEGMVRNPGRMRDDPKGESKPFLYNCIILGNVVDVVKKGKRSDKARQR